jgi:hypothetical protein
MKTIRRLLLSSSRFLAGLYLLTGGWSKKSHNGVTTFSRKEGSVTWSLNLENALFHEQRTAKK